MKKQNIDWEKVMNNAFIKPQLKWMQFLRYSFQESPCTLSRGSMSISAREQNKRVIMLKRKDRL